MHTVFWCAPLWCTRAPALRLQNKMQKVLGAAFSKYAPRLCNGQTVTHTVLDTRATTHTAAPVIRPQLSWHNALFGVANNPNASSTLYPEIQDTITHVKAIDSRTKKPKTTAVIPALTLHSLAQKPHLGLQATASEVVMDGLVAAHRATLSPRDCSIFDARAQAGASAWLNLSPHRADRAIKDDDLLMIYFAAFSLATPARFAGQQPIRGRPRTALALQGTCRARGCGQPYTDLHHHVRNCPALQNQRTLAHTGIQTALGVFANTVGTDAEKHPAAEHWLPLAADAPPVRPLDDPEASGDLRIHKPAMTVGITSYPAVNKFIDFTVHGTLIDFYNKGELYVAPTTTIATAEKTKARRYKRYTQDHTTESDAIAQYVTMAFTDAGGWSQSGLDLTQTLLRRAYPAVVNADGDNVDAQLERRNATRELRTSVALAIQRGNAKSWLSMYYHQQIKPHMAIAHADSIAPTPPVKRTRV